MTRQRGRGPLAAGLLAVWLAAPAWGAVEPASWPPATTRAPPEPGEARLYVLSFTDQDIAEVAGNVLGLALQSPFAVDPALAGTMSFRVDRSLTPDQLLAEFEVALAASGARIVRRPSGAWVTRAAAATAPAAPRSAPSPATSPATSDPGRANPQVWLLAGVAGGLLAGALGAAALLRRARPRAALVRAASVGRPAQATARDAVLDRLLAYGAIDAGALDRARVEARLAGRPVEQALSDMGAVSDRALVSAYADVTGCAVWRPETQPALDDQDGLAEAGLVAVARSRTRLTLAARDPLDDAAICAAAARAGRTVSILIGAPDDVRRASLDRPSEAGLEAQPQGPGLDGMEVNVVDPRRRLAGQA